MDDLLRVIRRRYSLAVMNAIHVRGAARYHEVASALPQASSSTLAETLQALQTAQLITRRADIAYALTLSGSRLLSRLRNLLDEVQPS